MTWRPLLALTLGSLGLNACSTIADVPTERLASAILTKANGVPAGTIQLLATGNRISMVVAVRGIPEGSHGFHLHAIGACKAPEFTSAGGHLNPTGRDHGKLSPTGSHLGDLPNLEVGRSDLTSTTIDLDNDRAQILPWLFDADGTAVVVHADADDYTTNPTGNAGIRIACGVLKPA